MNKEEQVKFIEKEFLKQFPNMKIKSIEKFKNGLVSEVYRIKIHNYKTEYALKFFKLEKIDNLKKNNLILNFLDKNKLPSVHVYLEKQFDNFGIVIMECATGKVISDFFKDSTKQIQQEVLFNTGEELSKIHKLKIPNFWIHNKHEIKSIQEWKDWTRLRIKKYLDFAKENLNPNQISFLENEFYKFDKLFNNNFELVPLHWDYHFSNINATKNGKITAIFDFDNAMKGHKLADIGQVFYWYLFDYKTNKIFEYFLKGYGQNFTDDDKKFIYLYFLLFLVAVMRTNWHKEKLKWLIEEHVKILNVSIGNKNKI
jgi:Ser/Thr protein kinase RdoA (MazF antagonist)